MIGILGGTFDPIHLGHCRMALEVCELNQLEQVRFIPCKKPVLKNAPLVSAENRLAMLKLAIKNEPRFIVDERELNRPSASYMIETLQSLQADYKDEDFGLIIGSDALQEFTRWKAWQEIIRLSKLLVVPRPSYSLEIPKELKDSVEIQKTTALPISSTQIRAAILTGRSARYWVSDSVLAYINTQRLYL